MVSPPLLTPPKVASNGSGSTAPTRCCEFRGWQHCTTLMIFENLSHSQRNKSLPIFFMLKNIFSQPCLNFCWRFLSHHLMGSGPSGCQAVDGSGASGARFAIWSSLEIAEFVGYFWALFRRELCIRSVEPFHLEVFCCSKSLEDWLMLEWERWNWSLEGFVWFLD